MDSSDDNLSDSKSDRAYYADVSEVSSINPDDNDDNDDDDDDDDGEDDDRESIQSEESNVSQTEFTGGVTLKTDFLEESQLKRVLDDGDITKYYKYNPNDSHRLITAKSDHDTLVDKLVDKAEHVSYIHDGMKGSTES